MIDDRAASPRWRLQWGHDDGVVEDGLEPAAPMDAADVASMGPRRWSRGRAHGTESIHGVPMYIASMGPRRWSRGRVECSDMTPSNSTAASMGPRQWSRGRASAIDANGCASTALQWGHDDGVVEEDCRACSTRRSRSKLQWGHDDGVVEEAIEQSPGTRRGRPSFNGATTMESWKTAPLGATCRIAVCTLFRERAYRIQEVRERLALRSSDRSAVFVSHSDPREGALRFFGITTELSKSLRRGSRHTAFSRQRRSHRVPRKNNDSGKQ